MALGDLSRPTAGSSGVTADSGRGGPRGRAMQLFDVHSRVASGWFLAGAMLASPLDGGWWDGGWLGGGWVGG